ncbi:MFS transporter [Slackia heliotrinireducens]|uniref:Arabinose efflux permease family protein n=1 Tax=Slackia heliotrinireducens (strain ATCC 29202 / DSM 20476 / NCTC 11029 / RHS 1) TaxID=471855 RepID=C7N4Y9_SLAHD|nr:MFS transporter [Slackia heliotrinireducens]ACV21974.1 arabinose efflux permease family protein [Slackia heliotrinireducens DSM 20476]VEG99847.1 Inner membrane transport protein ydiM [Slackia heliotrinireducens]
MSAAQQAKKYLLAIATTYMCYLTHGVQAIILSQNKVNFATQWGFDMSDPNSAAFAAGAAAVSLAITWTGVGKFVSVWIGGEISDRIGRKIPAVLGGVLYIICFVIFLVTNSATVACVAGFLSGVATSGFWDGALYPAIAEASPKYAGSTTIGIKAVISVSGIVYPLFAAMNSGANWHINIWIPIVMSVIATVLAIITPFVYDDERKQGVEKDTAGAKNAAEAEIQAARDAMLRKPNGLENFVTLFFGFIIMFIMYGAQQYSKAFGINNLGLSDVAAAGMTSIYTAGSIIAVLFWAFMMGKLRWSPIKVILIDSIIATVALAMVILALPLGLGAGVVYIAIALLGFGAAGGMLQTGVTLRQTVCPGPRGRNVGMYYTFMGFASVFLPFIVGSMTSAVGETQAVWVMMILLLVAALISCAMSAYLVAAWKGLFGKSAMAPQD